jgi:hypothetical protein
MMSLEPHRILSGILLEFLGGRIGRRDVERADLKFIRTIGGTPWEEFVFESPEPLIGEVSSESSHSFQYVTICRRSASRLLLLSPNRTIVDYLLERNFTQVFVPRLRHVPIAVDELVRAVVDKPSLYSLTRVYARVPAYGQNLRSVSYYGDDLGEATMFREQMDKLSFFVCGLRNAIEGHELIRLGNDGTVSFFVAQPESRRLREVEKVLNFLKHNHYLDIIHDEKREELNVSNGQRG